MKISKKFLALVLLALVAGFQNGAVAQQTGQVIGKVSLSGSASNGLSPELIVSASGGIQNAVVTIEGITGEMVNDPLLIDQKDKIYHNRISVTMIGSMITFQNSDALMHNVHTYQNGRSAFNLAMPHQNQTIEKQLRRPGLMEIKCDVHSDMKGYVMVTDSPYYALTNEKGLFEIGGVPVGTYVIKVWHETLGEVVQTVTVVAGTKSAAIIEFQGAAVLASSTRK